MKKVGIIGAGHMAGALLKGLLSANFVDTDHVMISGGKSGKAQSLAQELDCKFTNSNREIVKNSDILILGVIPKIIPQVLNEIKDDIRPDQLLISLAASFSYDDFYGILPDTTAIVRAIPNLPVAVKAGVTSLAWHPHLSAEQVKTVKMLFEAVGAVIDVEEGKLNVASALSGCSPAFFAMFIEAMADAGVMYGLNRKDAYFLAEQAALGTAKSLLDSGQIPAILKDDVASAGGVTIKGIAALEEYGMRNAVIQAIKASTGH